MTASYRTADIAFQYPANWELKENRSEDGLTVNLQSPGSAFLFVTLYDASRTPDELAQQALETMREEYAELESAPVHENIANRQAVGYDCNFFSLDLTNTCWIRAFSTPQHTILLFAQTNDLDLDMVEPVLHAILASMEIDELEGFESEGAE